jgi:hypothetical protein
MNRETADPPASLLEFSDGAFDVLFDAAHELTILMHGCRGRRPRTAGTRTTTGAFPAGLVSTKAMPCPMHKVAGKEGPTTSRRHHE